VVTLTIAGARPDDLARGAHAARTAIATRDVTTTEADIRVTVDDGSVAVAPLLRALDVAGLTLASVTVTRPSLDDVFLTLTGHSLREGDEGAPAATDAAAEPATAAVAN
jgi:ABC-2 type transport system ATP-binding protein